MGNREQLLDLRGKQEDTFLDSSVLGDYRADFYPYVSGENEVTIGPGVWHIDCYHWEITTATAIEVKLTGLVVFQSNRSNPAAAYAWSFLNQAEDIVPNASLFTFAICSVEVEEKVVTITAWHQRSPIIIGVM